MTTATPVPPAAHAVPSPPRAAEPNAGRLDPLILVLAALAALLALLGACARGEAVAGGGSAASAPDSAAYGRDLAAWKARRLDAIAGADGWATLTGLDWLREGASRAGADSALEVVLPAGHAPRLLGTFRRVGDTVRFAPAAGTAVTADGAPVAGEVPLRSDAGGARPTVLAAGSVSLRVIERGGRLALRVKDSLRAERVRFPGLAYWPADPAWRVVARLTPARPGDSLRVATVIGTTEAQPLAGTLAFTTGGRTHTLVATRETDTTLFVMFRDSTSGDGSYPAARYLAPAAPGPDGVVVLDFNRAYTPPCGFSAFATCPLPPRGNTLRARVAAGERYEGHAGGEADR